jgi:hypothetical protein
MSVTVSNKMHGIKKTLSPSNKHGLANFSEAYSVSVPGQPPIYISRPLIDRISIIGEIPKSVFGNGDLAKRGLKHFLGVFKLAVRDSDCKLKKAKSGKSSFAKGWAKKGELRAYIKIGSRRTRVEVAIQPLIGPEEKVIDWRLRLEWNPRKAGLEGFERLRTLLAHHLLLGPEGALEWFQGARITRLDIAVDILGVDRPSLFLRLMDQKKVQTYGRWTSGIETTNHKPSKGTKGTGGLSAYDKRQEQTDKKPNKEPKFGQVPHQRIERRFVVTGGKQPVLGKLAAETDKLAGPMVRLLRDLPDGSCKTDQQIVAGAVLWLGWKKMSGSLKGSQLHAWKVMKKHDAAFWDTGLIWKHWPEAVAEAGLSSVAHL